MKIAKQKVFQSKAIINSEQNPLLYLENQTELQVQFNSVDFQPQRSQLIQKKIKQKLLLKDKGSLIKDRAVMNSRKNYIKMSSKRQQKYHGEDLIINGTLNCTSFINNKLPKQKQLMTQNFDQSVSIDEQYIPNKKNYTSKSRIRKPKPTSENWCNSNKWSINENRKFLEFVKGNVELLSSQQRRKEEKVFLQLSKEVGTRSADQCRSHHQKMIKHHKDLKGIIDHLEMRLRMSDDKIFGSQQKIESGENMVIKQEDIMENNIETMVQIQLKEIEEEIQKERDIWQMLQADVWTNGSLIYSNINE